MRCAPGPIEKRILLGQYLWRCSFAAGLLLFLLIGLCQPGSASPPRAFAAMALPHQHGFAISPTSGPVGTVIVVTGSSLTYPDGTQVSMGYTTNFSTCLVVSNSQGAPIKNHAFSGWMSWPASTGAGNFGVCVVVSNFSSFLVANFAVLSASPPQVTMTPTVPAASHEATVTGANFLPGGATVNLVWQSASTGQTLSLGTATSDNTGAFTQTFVVPANTSTGSYSVTATDGTSQPPTLSASTTFQVTGVTIVPVGTPAARTSPTAGPTQVITSPTAVTIGTSTAQTGTGSGVTNPINTDGSPGLLIPIILVGLLLIVLALIGAVLLVHRQRAPAEVAAIQVRVAPEIAGPDRRAFIQGPGPVREIMSPQAQPRVPYQLSPGASPPRPPQSASLLPFDADLAEAMRHAQVSLFALPRPAVG